MVTCRRYIILELLCNVYGSYIRIYIYNVYMHVMLLYSHASLAILYVIYPLLETNAPLSITSVCHQELLRHEHQPSPRTHLVPVL